MKHKVTRFKSMEIALSELAPFVRDGRHIVTGRPLRRFGDMRPREILANWFLCAAINSDEPDRLTFTSDPTGGDGVLYENATELTWPTEHVMVPRSRTGKPVNVESAILKAVNAKLAKGGRAYAAGKILLVFLDANGGSWFPNKVARSLPDPLHFDDVWVIGREGADEAGHRYTVTQLDTSRGNAPTWRVSIAGDFTSWKAERVQ